MPEGCGKKEACSSSCKLLKRDQFLSLDDWRDQILAFITYYNRAMAKPIKWTNTGFSSFNASGYERTAILVQ